MLTGTPWYPLSEDEYKQALSALLPCPFCAAGETRISECDYWTGMSSVLLNITIEHWCEGDDSHPYKPFLRVKGRTLEQATARWNTRLHKESDT